MEHGLLSLLCDFLRDPHIDVRISDSDTVTQLEKAVERLTSENKRLSMLYSQEVAINLQYEDEKRSRA